MCGIMGYIGREKSLPLIIDGLKKESYRGYDSSGVVFFDLLKNSKDIDDFKYIKSVGKLENLEKQVLLNKENKTENINLSLGLGHNRWATHGSVTKNNCHPHADCSKNIFLVHNGIIENYQALKKKLKSEGHIFKSETDTEVLVHLIESFYNGDLASATRKALLLVKGAYAIAVISKSEPDKIIAARLSAPLVISINKRGGFVASDPAALTSFSNKMIFLDDKEIAVIKKQDFKITDLQNLKKEKEITKIKQSLKAEEKKDFEHFMLKEIMEQPESLSSAILGRLILKDGNTKILGLENIKKELLSIDKVQIIACGSAGYAAQYGEYVIENLAGISCSSQIGSEFRYKNPVFDKNTLSIFVSQSGETADTLAALKEIKEKGGLSIGIVNVAGSTLAREVGEGIYNKAGQEVAVATTKVFTSQLVILVLLALFLGRQRNLSLTEGQKIIKELQKLPELVKNILKDKEDIKKIAKNYKSFDNFWVIGRKFNYPIALEGALKLKEVAYLNATGIAAGELKHGSIALIDKNFPSIAICPSDSVYNKTVSNIQEIKARGGKVIAITTKGNKEIKKVADEVIYIPKTIEILTPILATIPLQLLAYYSAQFRGLDIDKPRNLAKSVTVE